MVQWFISWFGDLSDSPASNCLIWKVDQGINNCRPLEQASANSIDENPKIEQDPLGVFVPDYEPQSNGLVLE